MSRTNVIVITKLLGYTNVEMVSVVPGRNKIISCHMVTKDGINYDMVTEPIIDWFWSSLL